MAAGDHGLTLMGSTTLTSAASYVGFTALYTGDYEGLYCTGNIITTSTLACTMKITMPGTGNAIDVSFRGESNAAITMQRWTTNYGGTQQARHWNSYDNSAQGPATIGFEFWLQDRKTSGILKNAIYHGGSGEGVANTANKYAWKQGATSQRSQVNINDIYLYFVTTSNVATNMQIGSTFQMYGLRKS